MQGKLAGWSDGIAERGKDCRRGFIVGVVINKAQAAPPRPRVRMNELSDLHRSDRHLVRDQRTLLAGMSCQRGMKLLTSLNTLGSTSTPIRTRTNRLSGSLKDGTFGRTRDIDCLLHHRPVKRRDRFDDRAALSGCGR